MFHGGKGVGKWVMPGWAGMDTSQGVQPSKNHTTHVTSLHSGDVANLYD